MALVRVWMWLGWIGVATLPAFGAGTSQPGVDGNGSTSTENVIAPPSPRDARELGIGRYVPDAAGLNDSGKAASWRTGRGEKLTVIALTSVTCPLARKFAPSLARIEAAHASKGVKFVYVNVSGTDTADEMREQAKDHRFKGLYLNDTDHAIFAALHATTTTEVFVIDAGNTLLYRGALSDQYGVGFAHASPRRRFLENALDAALAGQRPAIGATNSPGCAIEFPPNAELPPPQTTTYARDIARIIQNNCVECHRAGGVAPFSLETFDAVSRRASMIRTVTQEGVMPPWFAAPADTDRDDDHPHASSPWANDRSLSQAEKQSLAAWIEAGKPHGDDADLPLPRAIAGGEWTIGKPDAVFQLPQPVEIKAEGVMPYQLIYVPTNLAEDKWVREMQIIPGDKAVVHHVLVYALPESALLDGRLRGRHGTDDARGFFAAYVPGNDAAIYPEGLAKRLPKGSVLLFQIHYTPNGKATRDQMKIGFVFDKQAPKHIVRTVGIANNRIEIPAHTANHQEHASVRLPTDATILSFLPHMHVRGKAFRYEIERSGEKRELLLDIPRYDFNWQLRYILREPLDAKRDSTLHATAWYDNSTDNPANPDPGKIVRWGPQTYDEMMLGYIEYYVLPEDPEHPEEAPIDPPPTRLRESGRAGGRSMFDANENGTIERSEAPANLHTQFDKFDRSGDGILTRDDFTPR